MSKRFTLVSYGPKSASESVLLSGFVELEEVSEVPEIISYLSELSRFRSTLISVAYLAFLEHPSLPILDASDEELEILDENFEDMLEDDLIKTLELLEFKVKGIR